jgi:hypothetical protein
MGNCSRCSNSRSLRYKTVVVKTCASQFNSFCFSQEENDDAKKLKEARLAAYAAKKAKSKYDGVNGVCWGAEVEPSPLVLRPFIGLLYLHWMTDGDGSASS